MLCGMVLPEKVATLGDFLLSEQASHTVEIIALDGGAALA